VVIDDRRQPPWSPRRAPPPPHFPYLAELWPEREKTASIRDSGAVEPALAGELGAGPQRRRCGWCRASATSRLGTFGAAPTRLAQGAVSSGHGGGCERGRGGHRKSPPWPGPRPWHGGGDSLGGGGRRSAMAHSGDGLWIFLFIFKKCFYFL
jgi:hypothetical protein